ncbi:hypothetical protein [Pseudodesulfovibrio indicus]|uniref:Uncharacterized protein n=1 Tax=Pseudodesulfovibrio indicus TaxID=1716143 RepID=A0A126QN01_9BACT|nr:hypothetical protein [Pseudodesulfovibrio indicus]AMK11342.1 hypothetical protein AWY79_09555 [Pseudodesulfovibrio indicus]TDT89729.1 hypothetical protein EDC59_10323 [Pseudodesulfovibrio indicus]
MTDYNTYDEGMAQLYAPKEAAMPRTGDISTNGAGMTCDESGRVVIHHDPTTYDVWDEQQRARSNGAHYLDTARTASGTPLMGRDGLTDESIVTLRDGTEARVKDLVTAGILTKNPDGTFSEAPSPKTAQDKPRQAQEAREELLDEGNEKTLHALGHMVDQSTIYGALNRLAAGDDIDSYIGRAASQVGKEPGEMAEIVGSLRSHFEAQAHRAVASMGLDPDQCFDWVRENRPRELHKAIMDHATRRTTAGYKALAGEFMADLDKVNPDAILNADLGEGILEARQVGNEIVLKTASQGEITWKTAVKMGLVKVGRK